MNRGNRTQSLSGKSASERVSEREGFQRFLEVSRGFQRFSEIFQRFAEVLSETLLSPVAPNRVAL